MTPMLLERYAKDGSEKSRRQMLAMCNSDPEILADVLSKLVGIASEKAYTLAGKAELEGPVPSVAQDELEEIMDDIQEALSMARRQGVLPPVRIARILAGEPPGQFSTKEVDRNQTRGSIPLSVALDYVSSILEESSREVGRLNTEIAEYDGMCIAMEREIAELNRLVNPQLTVAGDGENYISPLFDIDAAYAKLLTEDPTTGPSASSENRHTEAFWRELNQSEDKFGVIARYFAKGIIP